MSKISFIFTPFHKIILNYKRKRVIFQAIRWGNRPFFWYNKIYNLNEKGNFMKLISWNIDSLNAALTSDSARAKLSQEVLQTLVAENADIIAIQENQAFCQGSY